MAYITAPFILRIKNPANVVVSPITTTIRFSGGVIVTLVSPGFVDVNVSPATLGAWATAGNPSTGGGTDSGFVLGTTTDNSWRFITNNVSRGGFTNGGEFFLKTHTAFTGSEDYRATNGVQTTNATPTAIFTLAVPLNFVGRLICSIQGRRNDGLERSGFERSVLFRREGVSAILSAKVHAHFTDKTQDAYDVTIIASGTSIVVEVVGKIAETINWSGLFEWQMVGTDI